MIQPTVPPWFTQAIAHQPDKHSFTVNHARISCFTWGKRSKPALILLHGGFANSHWFSHIAPTLSTHHFIIGLDFSGHGHSSWRDAYTFNTFIEELDATICHFSLNEVSLAGHSFGARIAFLFCQQHPFPIKQLFMLDPPKIHQILPAIAQNLSAKKTIKYYNHSESITSRFRIIPPQPIKNTYICDFIAKNSIKHSKNGFTWQADPNLFHKFYHPTQKSPSMPQPLPQSSIIVHGEHSSIATEQTIDSICTHHPNIKTIMLKNSHHALMIDQPLKLLSTLEKNLL